MAKIDPAQELKGTTEQDNKIQVVCGLGVVLTSKGTVESTEIKGIPMPEIRTAFAIMSSAAAELQSHIITNALASIINSSSQEDSQEDEDPSEEMESTDDSEDTPKEISFPIKQNEGGPVN
jgi:hypothetical protein